ncbi:cadherin-like domain-containing protein, partial [Polynucleobacter sp. 71A-WALBACH]|uniref:cadherin-like domain-containing protein n=1 Tax=Polynucleobacter sp. 71A-WALBACH TaxID=2689097 RepID=UPI001C0D90A3
MADRPSNAPTTQQVNDAQHLDNMTSLQQPSAAEQSPITQNGEVKGDAPIPTTPTPNPDNPSLFNEPKNPNNKVVEVDSQKPSEALDEGTISNTPSDQGSKFTENLSGLKGDAVNLTLTVQANELGKQGDTPPELDPGVNKAGGNSGNQGSTGGGGIPRAAQAPAGTPAAASPASPTSSVSQPNSPTTTQTVEPARSVEAAPTTTTPQAPNPVTPQAQFIPEEPRANQASILAPDSQTISEDSTAVGNVLGNDSDVDSALTVTSFSINGITYTPGQAAVLTGVGSVTIAADGAYLFTPEPNWSGAVPTIGYTTNTEKQSTLTITVSPVDDSFTDANESITVAEDSSATTGSVLTGTSSVDGTVTVKSFVIAGSATVHNAGDTVTITGKGDITLNADGSYSFTPAANYNGAIPVITYTLSDDAGLTAGDTSTLTITVSPVDDSFTDANESITVAEDSSATTGSVLTGTSSVDG